MEGGVNSHVAGTYTEMSLEVRAFSLLAYSSPSVKISHRGLFLKSTIGFSFVSKGPRWRSLLAWFGIPKLLRGLFYHFVLQDVICLHVIHTMIAD